MVVFFLLGAATFGLLGIRVWRLTLKVKTESEQTIYAIEKAARALGGITREVDGAKLHLARLKQLRVRRILVDRVVTRGLRRLLARRRT